MDTVTSGDGEHGRAEEVHESIRVLIVDESTRSRHSKQSNATICMVPITLRNLNPSAYTPRILSIGPFHRKDPSLKDMEEHKVTYMCRLFHHIAQYTDKDVAQISRKCVQAMLGLVTRARACYAQSFIDYSDSKFAEMMVIDGCFIIELLYKFQYGIVEGDQISDNILVRHDVKNDLLLLENQIPFFVLEILFRLTVKRMIINYNTLLTDLVLCFFKDMNIIQHTELTLHDNTLEYCHILGLFQSCYGHKGIKLRSGVPTNSYSATKIDGAGVKFKAKTDDEDSVLAVKFQKASFVPWLVTFGARKTFFKIPVVCIKDNTASLLRNLIAYEQCYPLTHLYVTSFAFLMYKLIDTKDDLSLLVTSKVLQHSMGASKDVTKLFNSICNGVILQDIYYTEEWRQLDDYCNRPWPSMWIKLRRLYSSTPWKTLTFIAAGIIFALALVQTIRRVHNS